LLAPRSADVKVVVTDLQMPHLDGASLASVVRRLNPAIRILTMSGMDSARTAEAAQRFAGAFLAKPFKSEDLLVAVAGCSSQTPRRTGSSPSPVNHDKG